MSTRIGDTVVKPAASNSNRSATGPQSAGAAPKYNVNDLRFPKELAINAQNRHWIHIIPTIQKAGSYNIKLSGEASTANFNRGTLGGQLSSSPISGFDAIGAGLILGAIGATGSAIGGALQSLGKGSTVEKFKSVVGGLAGAAGGLAKAGIAGAVIAGLDLSRKTRRAAAHICLYMPDTVNYTMINDYDQVSLTQALGQAGLALQAGKEVTAGDLKGVGGGFGPGVNEVTGILAEKTGLFGAGITDVLLFNAGYAQNPQIELLFKSIQNREFLFDFKLVAKTRDEAVTIKNIIQTLRFHAAPEIPKTGGGRYFVPPDEFDIRFMYGDKENPNIPKISTCVLQGIDVNYASAGQWTTFWNGSPVEIALQLRFKEVEILHKELVNQGF